MNCDEFESEMIRFCIPERFVEIPDEFREHYETCPTCHRAFLDECRLKRYLAPSLASQTEKCGDASGVPWSDDTTPVASNDRVRVEAQQPFSPAFRDVTMSRQLSLTNRPSPKSLVEKENIGIIPPYSPRRMRFRIALRSAAVIAPAVAILAAFFMFPHQFARPVSRNELLATQAGKALEAGRYEEVVSLANECLGDFMATAKRRQAELEQLGMKRPIGKVSSSERISIQNDGPLNDCASVLYYKGRAFEKLGKWSEARQAYEEATQLSLGRCWDPDQSIFWSPAEVASDRLRYGDEQLRSTP